MTQTKKSPVIQGDLFDTRVFRVAMRHAKGWNGEIKSIHEIRGSTQFTTMQLEKIGRLKLGKTIDCSINNQLRFVRRVG